MLASLTLLAPTPAHLTTVLPVLVAGFVGSAFVIGVTAAAYFAGASSRRLPRSVFATLSGAGVGLAGALLLQRDAATQVSTTPVVLLALSTGAALLWVADLFVDLSTPKR